VTEQDCQPAEDAVDPTAPGYGTHLAFHQVLQRCGVAWRAFLASLPGVDKGLIVPNMNADFIAEVQVGTLDIDVRLVRIGTSSFTVVCEASQDGTPAASVDVVLANFDYNRRTTFPLTPGQLTQLGSVLAN
jgi:acyl-CoA thioesterase FadM